MHGCHAWLGFFFRQQAHERSCSFASLRRKSLMLSWANEDAVIHRGLYGFSRPQSESMPFRHPGLIKLSGIFDYQARFFVSCFDSRKKLEPLRKLVAARQSQPASLHF